MSLAFAAFPRDVLCMQSLSLHCHFIPNYHTLFCPHWNQLVTHCRIKTQHLQKLPFSPHHPHALSQPPRNIPCWNPSPKQTLFSTKCLCCSSHKRLPIVNHASVRVRMCMEVITWPLLNLALLNTRLKFDICFKWALFFNPKWLVHFCLSWLSIAVTFLSYVSQTLIIDVPIKQQSCFEIYNLSLNCIK